MLAVEREWDPQAIAYLLGGKLGESCRSIIMREVPNLINKLADAERRVERLHRALEAIQNCGDSTEHAIARAALAETKEGASHE